MARPFSVFALVVALALSGCWEGTSRSVSGTVLSVQGEAGFAPEGSTAFQPTRAGDYLRAGSIVHTAKGAQLYLMLIPGALAQVSADSELKIEELALQKDGNETGDAVRERVARIELRRGGIVVLFEGAARFTIAAREVTINVLPSCLLRLDIDEKRTRATCVRGRFYATPSNGQVVAVDSGYFREWPAEGGAAVSAAEDERGRRDIMATLEAARKLQELAAAQRDRLPF